MVTLTDTQQVDITVSAADKAGAKAAVQSISYASSDDAIATVKQDAADQAKATVVAHAAGAATINVAADADLGDGVRTITASLDFTVTAGGAATIAVNAGTPVEQPPAPAPPVV